MVSWVKLIPQKAAYLSYSHSSGSTHFSYCPRTTASVHIQWCPLTSVFRRTRKCKENGLWLSSNVGLYRVGTTSIWDLTGTGVETGKMIRAATTTFFIDLALPVCQSPRLRPTKTQKYLIYNYTIQRKATNLGNGADIVYFSYHLSLQAWNWWPRFNHEYQWPLNQNTYRIQKNSTWTKEIVHVHASIHKHTLYTSDQRVSLCTVQLSLAVSVGHKSQQQQTHHHWQLFRGCWAPVTARNNIKGTRREE